MKYSFIWLGVLVLLGALFFLKAKWEVYNVERDGQIVEMEIIKLPNNCSITKRKYYMDVTYQGEIFNKRIPVGFCDKHKIGELIKMKYSEGYETILFPEEKVLGDFIAIGIFITVSIASIFYGIFSKKKQISRR
ncbi:hypothetical protein [Longitalea luteola]|uniref:hypothetical protein n=1 Tax=Longitalea luteola TaxID=2812563 RepID=UPI001A95B7DA|nr:hypothetical protein [Longitalea luteola]